MSPRHKSKSDIILSVAVTAHAEGRLLRPTLRSVAAAIQPVLDRGMAVELLIVLDNPSDETRREAERWLAPGRSPVPVRLLPTSFGDAAASRNAAVDNARGDYLALCDGDDLVSRDYLISALDLLLVAADPLILHPSLVISFGARTARWVIPATEQVDHLDLIRHNLWPSSSVSQRSTYLAHRYVELPPESGFGPEDWLWNIETSIAGIPHRPAPQTVFFYRVRATGGVNNRHQNSILPPFDLEGLRAALPLQVPLSAKAGVRRATIKGRTRRALRGTYRRVLPLARVLTRRLPESVRGEIYMRGRRLYDFLGDGFRKARRLGTVSPALAAALYDAAQIEPAISWTAVGILDVPEWLPVRDRYSPILVSLVEQLRGRAEGLVVVPWLGIGGADLVSLNYARALHQSDRFGHRVAILATHLPSRTLRHLLPPEITFVQVPEAWRELHPDLQRRLIAQVFLLTRPRVIVSVNAFDTTNALQRYGRQVGSFSRIFLTLFAFDRIGAGYPTNPITDDSQRSYLDEIGAILTDNSVTRDLVEELLALGDERVHIHRQPALSPTPAIRRGSRAYNNSYFSDANPFLLLWPHRLDKEKRPEALVAIAHGLRDRGIPAKIHVYGQQVLSGEGQSLMKSLADAGVEYRGPYEGGLSALSTEDYHALLLTSESEGLPLVLVQAMLLGLPVIATAVGGVTDIIRGGYTGLLAAGPDDTDGFVEAIERLYSSRDERRRLIESAYAAAVEEHSWESFIAAVERELD